MTSFFPALYKSFFEKQKFEKTYQLIKSKKLGYFYIVLDNKGLGWKTSHKNHFAYSNGNLNSLAYNFCHNINRLEFVNLNKEDIINSDVLLEFQHPFDLQQYVLDSEGESPIFSQISVDYYKSKKFEKYIKSYESFITETDGGRNNLWVQF